MMNERKLTDLNELENTDKVYLNNGLILRRLGETQMLVCVDFSYSYYMCDWEKNNEGNILHTDTIDFDIMFIEDENGNIIYNAEQSKNSDNDEIAEFMKKELPNDIDILSALKRLVEYDKVLAKNGYTSLDELDIILENYNAVERVLNDNDIDDIEMLNTKIHNYNEVLSDNYDIANELIHLADRLEY